MLSKTVLSHGRKPTTRRVIAQPSICRAGSRTCQRRKPAAVIDRMTDGMMYDFGQSPPLP